MTAIGQRTPANRERRSAPTAGRRAEAAGRVERGNRLLLIEAACFTAAVLLHGADHLRRGVGAVHRDVFWLGTAGIVLEIGVVVLVCRRHRLAPLAAAAIGFVLAAGYAGVHYLPARAWFSDSLASAARVNALSWFASAVEIVTALALGVAGVVVTRDRGGARRVLTAPLQPPAEQRSLGEGFLHPVALTMTIGSVVLLAASVAQLASA